MLERSNIVAFGPVPVMAGGVPVPSTGDAGVDRRLRDAFYALLDIGTKQDRLVEIERLLFTTNDFPPPDSPPDLYRVTLTRWWLAIFNSPE